VTFRFGEFHFANRVNLEEYGAAFMQQPMPDLSRQNLVYVLDDDPEVASLVCAIVASSGMLPSSFDTPQPFLESVKTTPPDFVVLDISLGKSDAVEVIRKLDGLAYRGGLLLFSGHSQEILAEVHAIGLAHGLAMLPTLHKPFHSKELKTRLNAKPEAVPHYTRAANAKLSIDLPQALEKKWLELWYQPKIDLKSRQICGGEALIRLRHPEHGVISPGDFLPAPLDPIFEPISIFVLSAAMKHAQILIDQKVETKISINMPASFVMRPGFISDIRLYLPKGYSGLVLEITEDDVIRDAELIREVATQLKILNVGMSIDDFGVAQASLARLMELPWVELKLDRSFVSGCSLDPLKRVVCQTVVDLARSFKISACAEGVETPEELNSIVEMGFDTAQGYLFARPMVFESFVESLVRNAESRQLGG